MKKLLIQYFFLITCYLILTVTPAFAHGGFPPDASGFCPPLHIAVPSGGGPGPPLCQEGPGHPPPAGGAGGTSCTSFTSCLSGIVSPGLTVTSSAGLPATFITLIFPAVLGILGFIAVYYMVLASIRLIISKGEPEKVAEARSRLIYAVVGFIVLILSYAFLRVIDTLFLHPT